MLMDIKKEGELTIISLREQRLTAAIASEFSKSVSDIVKSGPETIIMDMSDVSFMDSSGLGALIAIKKAANNECNFKVCSVSSEVMEILKLTRMNQVLDIYESVQLAQAA